MKSPTKIKTASNENLQRARDAKKNEFYTQLPVIAKELAHYKEHFRGKVVYCNCDDPRNCPKRGADQNRPHGSWFYFYFKDQFGEDDLGLKELIASTYRQPDMDARREHADLLAELEELKNPPPEDKFKPRDAVYVRYHGNGNGRTGRPHKMQGDNGYHGGDFRSQQSIKLLKQADIVCTNPPFSLFRDYVDQLVNTKNDKGENLKFLILGSMNAISYKEIFPLIKAGKIWLGVNNDAKQFACPPHAEDFDEYDTSGNKIKKMGNVFWYTNLMHDKRSKGLTNMLTMDENRTNGVEYPRYDNYDAIEVSKVTHIPEDYPGVMGVPISFMDAYNPEQFEIVGVAEDNGRGQSGGVWQGGSLKALVGGKAKFKRMFIRHKRPQK